MEILTYFNFGMNVVLILFLFCYLTRSNKEKKHPDAAPIAKQDPQPAEEQKPSRVVNAQLQTIAEACEAKLPEADRGKVKLLVRDEKPEQLALLKIGNLYLSLCRDNKNQSLFKIDSFLEALRLANKGYSGTGRYIPIPEEVEFLLSQRRIINVYLEALGLEKISAEDDFWCVDVKAGWNTGWKRFDWSVDRAFVQLHAKSRIRMADGHYLAQTISEDKVNLFLLCKGWEHLFIEV